MYAPQPLAGGQPPQAVALASLARIGRLVVYAGAGLSRAEPSDIPVGAEIARRTYQRLAAIFDSIPPCNENDLTSVADNVASLDGGIDALRNTVVQVAEFTSADSNYGHKVLALLLLEGAIDVLTTNWDDCIERGCRPERLQATISAVERVQLNIRALLKMHGCATRPPTLLITTAEIDEPQEWVSNEVGARLADSHVVFVGIGDVAAYVREGIDGAVAAVGNSDNVRIVSPSISSGWATSEWATILPGLAADHRIGMGADEFLDVLAGAYIRQTLLDIDGALDDNPRLQNAFRKVKEPLELHHAVAVLTWLRAMAVPPTTGESVVNSDNTAKALTALGLLAAGTVVITKDGAAHSETQRFVLLVALGLQTATRMRREADNRLAAYLADGGDAGTAPTFVAACPFPIGGGLTNLPEDLVGTTAADDVLAGPASASAVLVDAAEVLRS